MHEFVENSVVLRIRPYILVSSVIGFENWVETDLSSSSSSWACLVTVMFDVLEESLEILED